ncbi:outer membrane protein [Algisphaera agarilytica]|uniref:outer membrane protein n=1 Tax=Algisphaera agarilytica TaxID=1385975 RepID=UPI001C871C7E|nr:outer membrane beta-barrel protein [Algisphaera agarilytica]
MLKTISRSALTTPLIALASLAICNPSSGQSLREIDESIATQDGSRLAATGFYIGGMGSFTVVEDSELVSTNGGTPASPAELEFEDGFGSFGFIGWDFGALRTELEVGARSTELDRVTLGGAPIAGANGDIFELSLMFNLIADIPITDGVELYVGGGVGGAYLWSDVFAPGLALGDSEDYVFAYQAMGGVQFEVAPRLYLNAGYRIHSFDDPNFSGNQYDAPLIHSLDVGIRYVF